MISYENKFLFIHVPRTGGTSIEYFFKKNLTPRENHGFSASKAEWASWKAQDKSGFVRPEKDLLKSQHIHAHKAQDIFLKNNINYGDFFKFSFVRNPWERLVSYYFYNHYTYVALNEAVFRPFSEFMKAKIVAPEPTHSYKKNALLFGGNEYTRLQSRPLFTQEFWLFDDEDNLLVDFVGRFENLQSDFDLICDKLQIPRGTLRKERACGDVESCPWHQQRGIKIPKYNHYTQYYDAETLDLVNGLVQKEADYWGYKFGE